jgi:hypothetical protein
MFDLLQRRALAGISAAPSALLALFTPVLLADCAARPCACSTAQSALPKPTPNQESAPTSSATGPAALEKQAAMVWDGEDADTRARGWAACEEKESCLAQLTVKSGAGRNGSMGLELAAKGKKWIGFGWNWFGWWPDNAGTDISTYKSLRFWLKVSAEPGKQKPPRETLRVSLRGSSKGGKDATASVAVGDYAPALLDGEWHEIVMPLEPLFRGDGETFDNEKAWELDFGAWTTDECEYTLAIDEVAFL